jgi:mannose/fructose/N-acetylgalactosamine-specific phosphotransferase system component IIC
MAFRKSDESLWLHAYWLHREGQNIRYIVLYVVVSLILIWAAIIAYIASFTTYFTDMDNLSLPSSVNLD